MANTDDTQFPLSPVESTDRTIAGNVLSIDDLHDVFDTISTAADHWYNIGLALNVDVPTLSQIKAESSNSNRLQEMLTHWMQSGPSTTWQDIIDALSSQSVERSVAEEIGRLSNNTCTC